MTEITRHSNLRCEQIERGSNWKNVCVLYVSNAHVCVMIFITI